MSFYDKVYEAVMTVPKGKVATYGQIAAAFAFGGQEVQAELLMKEGVEVRDDFTVDLERYRYRG